MEFFNKKYFNEVAEQVENYFNIIEAKINNNINNLNNDVIITDINIVDDEEEDFLLYNCDFIDEVQFNQLALMSFHGQEIKKLGDIIEERIYLYKNTLLNKQGKINIDDANNFIKDIFKFYYHLKNKQISYTTAFISVNEYTSIKIRNIKPIEKSIEEIPVIKPKYTPNIIIDQRHEKIKESKRKYYEKNKEKYKIYAKLYYEKSKTLK
jgi:hypothetical protein